MHYIGIDPSTKTGLVIIDETGAVLLEKEITSKERNDPQRFIDLSSRIMFEVDQLCFAEDIRITIEGFSYGSRGKGVSTQYGVGWSIRTELVKNYIPYIEVSPNTLKKFATGKGNVKKEDMILPINDRWGYRNKSDNIRDAYVLAQIGRALDGHGKPTKVQLDCIKGL